MQLVFGCNREAREYSSKGYNITHVQDENLEQVIIDNIQERMDSQFSNEEAIVRALPKGQRAIYITWVLEAEVNNGGFNQFYYNSSGQFADLTEEALLTIGATKFAELARQANLTYDSIKDDLKAKDDGTIESFSKSYEANPLNDLDDKFYSLDRAEPLSEIKIKYIRNHIEDFMVD